MTHGDGFPRFSARSARRGDAGASRGVRDAVRKPWKAAVPVASTTRRRASESLDDSAASPAALLLPGGALRRSPWVIISAPWYKAIGMSPHRVALEAVGLLASLP